MNPMDISALFGNALDNAIESVKKLPNPEQRLIHVSAMRQKDFLRIRVENCYSGELRFVDGMPTTTKRDARYHGYGLKSIQSIANSYGGSATIDTKDGWFELRLLLPVPKEKRGKRRKSVMKEQKHKRKEPCRTSAGKHCSAPLQGEISPGKPLTKGLKFVTITDNLRQTEAGRFQFRQKRRITRRIFAHAAKGCSGRSYVR